MLPETAVRGQVVANSRPWAPLATEQVPALALALRALSLCRAYHMTYLKLSA